MKRFGFTLVEILVVVTVISILATISVVAYNGVQKRAADTVVSTSVKQADEALQAYFATHKDYPPNLAAVGYAAPDTAVLALYTNAPTVRKYSAGYLNSDQNAQLFLNSCNAVMPVVGTVATQNNCSFPSNTVLFVSASKSSVALSATEPINQSAFALRCGTACDSATATIINDFLSQGGTFPIMVPNSQVTLPEPDIIQATGNATNYCLEGSATEHSTTLYHISASDKGEIQDGACPNNPDLHYP